MGRPALLLAILMMTATGCDRPEANAARSDAAVELTVMFAPDSTGVWRSLCAAFEKQHPHIRVDRKSVV